MSYNKNIKNIIYLLIMLALLSTIESCLVISDGYFVAKSFKDLVKGELPMRFRGLVSSLEGCHV